MALSCCVEQLINRASSVHINDNLYIHLSWQKGHLSSICKQHNDLVRKFCRLLQNHNGKWELFRGEIQTFGTLTLLPLP